MLVAAVAAAEETLTLECDRARQSLPLQNRGGESWVLFKSEDLTGLGEGAKIEVEFPYATLSWGAASVRLAVGVGRACRTGPKGSDVIWLAGEPQVIDGVFAVPAPVLACVLAHMGAEPAWIVPGSHLRVSPERKAAALPAPSAKIRASPASVPVGAAAPARKAQVREPAEPFHIVLDPGHGGADCGAYGRSKLCEKVVTLDLCRRIVPLLKKAGLRVTMTRNEDKYVSLEKRVEIARRAKADLFLSVHVNASRDRRAHGVETYVYGRQVKNAANAALVRRENADANYVDIIVSDLNEQQYHDSSICYAGFIEDQLVRRNKLYGRAQQRVMEAPFYVLARAQQPAVLIEVGFISNAKEEHKLRSPSYRQQLAETIADGLLQVKSTRASK